jgi:hypothetical protein
MYKKKAVGRSERADMAIAHTLIARFGAENGLIEERKSRVWCGTFDDITYFGSKF